MFNVLIMAVVALIALHVASYGWYALRREQNRRGAAGAFVVALVTLGAPLVLILVNMNR